jgi:RIO kinase 1
MQLKNKENKSIMSNKHNFKLYEQLEDLENIPTIRNVPERQLRDQHKSKPKPSPQKADAIFELAEAENALNFTYSASKHEREWLISSLKEFHQQGWFNDVLRLIKGGGKEASVYQCVADETQTNKYIAAKVYRPRKFRQLRNDALYRQGRLYLDDEGHEIRDDRALHAIAKRTRFGMSLMHTSWIEHEFQAMKRLHKAGADIPKPYASGNNAILMAYIGWDDLAAPTLNEVNLSNQEAKNIFKRIINNVRIMLANGIVHGDLSAYNILYKEGDITLIDFPQVMDPQVNRSAYPIFCRDIKRVCEYFQAQGLHCHPQELAENLWFESGLIIAPAYDPSLMTLNTSQFDEE